MKRFAMALVFVAVLAVTALAGDIPSGDFLSQPPPHQSSQQIPHGAPRSPSGEKLVTTDKLVIAILQLVLG